MRHPSNPGRMVGVGVVLFHLVPTVVLECVYLLFGAEDNDDDDDVVVLEVGPPCPHRPVFDGDAVVVVEKDEDWVADGRVMDENWLREDEEDEVEEDEDEDEVEVEDEDEDEDEVEDEEDEDEDEDEDEIVILGL